MRAQRAIVGVIVTVFASTTPTVVYAGFCSSLWNCFQRDPFFWTLVFILAIAALVGLAMLLGPAVVGLFAEGGEIVEVGEAGGELFEVAEGDAIEREELQGLLEEIRGKNLDCGDGAEQLLKAAGEGGTPTPVSGVGEHYVAQIGKEFVDTVPQFWQRALTMNPAACAAIEEAVPGLASRLASGATMTWEEFTALQNALVRIGNL